MDYTKEWESATPIKSASFESEWENATPLEEEKKKKISLGETASQAGSDFVSGLMRSFDTLKAHNPQTVPSGTVPSRPDGFKEFVKNEEKPQEDLSIPQQVWEGAKHLATLPSHLAQEVLSNSPTKILDKTLGGVANSLDKTYEFASKGLATPAVNSVSGTSDNFMNTSVNPYLEQRRKESENYIKDSSAGEVGMMMSDPLNVLLGGTGGFVKKFGQGAGVGGLMTARDAYNNDQPIDAKQLTSSALLMGLLGGGHALLKGKEAPRTEARTEGMTPEEIAIADNLSKQFEQAKPIEKDTYADNSQVGERRTMEEIKQLIAERDEGGEAQAKLFEEQMNAWADAENLRRKEQGLNEVTAEDMANSFMLEYENKAKPTDAELKVLFDTVTDTDGNIKTMEQRNKSNGWQDVTSKDQYGQEYTRRMAGEYGLESEFRTDTKTLKKLQEQGYKSLTPAERAMVDKDIETIRNHPDFRDENQVLADNGELFQSKADNGKLTRKQLNDMDKEYFKAIADGDIAKAQKMVDEYAIKKGYSRENSFDKSSHTAPYNDGFSKPIHDMTDIYPDDIYTHGAQYYGDGVPYDNMAISILRRVRNNPEARVTIYRAIPKDLKETRLRDGDWVTISKEYAHLHGKKTLNGKYKIIQERVPAKHIYTNGDSLHEQGYDSGSKNVGYKSNVKGNRKDMSPFIELIDNENGNTEYIQPLSKRFNEKETAEFYQKDANIKGSYTTNEKLIKLFESHDVSTLNHELGHRFYFTLSAKERGIIHEIFGVKDGKWETKHHEAFADAYARYIAEGKAPSAGIKAVFEKFTSFMKEILLKLKENNGGKMPPLSKEAKEFFAAVLGNEKARNELMKKYQAKEAMSMGEGELFQTARTERMMEWHKDSAPETKNADGTPKILYHGSPDVRGIFNDGQYKSITRGDVTFFTDDYKTANSYADPKRAFDYQNAEEGVIPNYVKLKTPMIIDAKGQHWKGTDGFIKQAKEAGHDGLIIKNSVDFYNNDKSSKPSTVYVVFNDGTGQIKSALTEQMKSRYDGKPIPNALPNKGTFDETNPNILYQIPQNLLAPDQRPTIGDDVAKFKAGYAKVKETLGTAIDAFRDMTPDFYKELTSDRFTAIASLSDKTELIHKALIKLSPETNKILQQAIVGDIKSLPQGYQTLQPLVDAIRTEVKAMTKKLVDMGMLDKETADAYADSYLKRSYEGHWAEKNGDVQSTNDAGVKPIIARGKDLKSDSPDEILSFVEDYLKANKKKPLGTVMDITDIKDHLQNEGLLSNSIVDGKIVWKEENGKVVLRRDWTKAEREAMKEIENASLSVPNTILSMGTMIHNAELMKELSQYAKDFKDIEEAKAYGYDQIPNTKRYGMLAGKYVDKHIVDQVKYTFEQRGELFDLWTKSLSVWKQGKTVFNPTSHVNNFVGNIFTQFMLGRDLKEAGKMTATTVEMLKEFPTKIAKYEEMRTRNYIGMLDAKEKAEFASLKSDLKYYIEGKENGLFGRGQIQDILKGFDAVNNSFGNKGSITKTIEAVQRAYQRGDDIPRLSSYKVLRENGMTPKEAKDFVTALYPDYSKPLPKGVRFLRDWGISPFISWSYYVLPTLAKLVKAHPLRATALVGSIYAMSYALSGINPFGDDIPDKEQGRRVPISKDGTTLKVDRMIAGSDFMALPMDAVSKVVQGYNKGDTMGGVNKAVSATGRNVGKLAQSYLYGGVPQFIGDIVTNKNSYTGRPISGDTDSATKQAYNYIKHIGGFLAPAPVANIGGIVENEINPKLKKKHSDVIPRTNTQELLKQLGLNIQRYDTNEVRRRRLLEDRKLSK